MFKKDRKRYRRRAGRRDAAYEDEHTRRRTPKKKLPGWVIIPIIGGIVLICFGISKVTGGNDKGTQLNVVEAHRESIKEIYNTSGTVVSEKSKTFYSPVNAPVKKNKAEVGKAVKKGDKLITFDTTNLDRENQTSRLNTLSAKYTNQDAKEQSGRTAKSMKKAKEQENAMISELKTQIKEKTAKIKKLEKQVKASEGESAKTAKEIAGIQKQMTDNLDSQSICQAKKENIERQLDNLEESDQGTEQSKEELVKQAEEATNEISALEREYRTLEQKLKQLGGDGGAGDSNSAASQSLAQAKQELEALKSSLAQAENSRQTSADTGLTAAQLSNMKVSEDLAKLAELSSKELLEKGKKGIKAEFDGIISDVKVLEGGDAVQGGELFTLVSNRDVSVQLEVSAGDFENLVPGEKAVITIGRRTYQGTLESVNKIALANEKGNPVIGAKLRIDDPDDDIYIGVNAKVNITVAEKEDALCLPNEVINTASDGDFVYMIENGTVIKRKVEIGVSSTSMSEIASGIKEGDQVVADMSDDLKEGMKATAVKSEDSSDKGTKQTGGE
ncbi:MAG: efflux RND transporter periplasmic adaptor subunit [Dorea sp.]|jgi:HlyD family secretion protein|nr:efflux RND transporter periplasmic adaptor subunit [Dorea sp.]